MGSYCCSVAKLCLTFCDPMDRTTQDLLTIWNFVSKMMSQHTVEVHHSFSSKQQAFFNFMATATIHSDFGAQENEGCHHFYFFTICLT